MPGREKTEYTARIVREVCGSLHISRDWARDADAKPWKYWLLLARALNQEGISEQQIQTLASKALLAVGMSWAAAQAQADVLETRVRMSHAVLGMTVFIAHVSEAVGAWTDWGQFGRRVADYVQQRQKEFSRVTSFGPTLREFGRFCSAGENLRHRRMLARVVNNIFGPLATRNEARDAVSCFQDEFVLLLSSHFTPHLMSDAMEAILREAEAIDLVDRRCVEESMSLTFEDVIGAATAALAILLEDILAKKKGNSQRNGTDLEPGGAMERSKSFPEPPKRTGGNNNGGLHRWVTCACEHLGAARILILRPPSRCARRSLT